MKKVVFTPVLTLISSQSFALNILMSNDDGLLSHVKVLTEAMRAAG